jgi:hypothetical protein
MTETITKYLIVKQNVNQYVDILLNNLPSNIILKHTLTGIKQTDTIIVISIKLLSIALKLGFKNVYYFNIEQMTIRTAFLENKYLSHHANRINIMLNELFKQDFNKFKLLDYSKENVLVWDKHLSKTVNHIIEPYYPLQKNITQKDKTIDYISLINHDYRPMYIKKYLPNINPRIKNFLGYFDDNRRTLLQKSKIMINIHTSENHIIGELFRLNEAISHKVIVISQSCYKNELLTLSNFIIWVNNDTEMESKCQEILENYDTYFKSIYIDNLVLLEQTIQNIKNNNITTFNNL